MLVMNNVYKIITFVIVPLDRFRLLCRSGVFCVCFCKQLFKEMCIEL